MAAQMVIVIGNTLTNAKPSWLKAGSETEITNESNEARVMDEELAFKITSNLCRLGQEARAILLKHAEKYMHDGMPSD